MYIYVYVCHRIRHILLDLIIEHFNRIFTGCFNSMLPPTAYLISPRTPTSHINESCHIWIRHVISCWLNYSNFNRMLPPTAYLISPRTPTSHMNESCHIWIRHVISCWLMYRILQQDTAQTGLGSTEGASYEGTPLQNANGPAAGGSTTKSGGSTSKPMQAILFSSFTQVLQLFVTLSCPRCSHPQLSLRSYFSMSYFSRLKFSLFLVYFSLLFSIWFFSFQPDGQISSWPIWTWANRIWRSWGYQVCSGYQIFWREGILT